MPRKSITVVNKNLPEPQIHGMKAEGRGPVHLLRRMMDRMEAPKARTVKQAVAPVEQEIRGDDVDRHLRPERRTDQAGRDVEHEQEARLLARVAERLLEEEEIERAGDRRPERQREVGREDAQQGRPRQHGHRGHSVAQR